MRHEEPISNPTEAERDERAVRSLPLDTDDGSTVVIEQQNMGGVQQVGGGEYKSGKGRTVDQAAQEQAELERQAPINGDPESQPGR